MSIPAYPFSAIIDQENMKLALLLNAINPRIGGVLIRGAKGTGKSTAVRALAELLPEIEIVKGCPFNCNPKDPTNMCEVCRNKYENGEPLEVEKRKMRIVTLPIGATEDRVVGTLDITRAIKEGVKALEPGLLAEANQNILYIDEINLLPDHIVDDILDAAASGWNVVEREGISVAHPARFILIGTMNPEEGELRPQLLDRLALHVQAENIYDKNMRIEIMKRNLEYEEDPEKFRKKYEQYQSELRRRIIQARELLPKVKVPEKLLDVISRLCIRLRVDGHRPDIIILKTARTLAAFEGKTEVTLEYITTCAKLALSHRTRRGGLEEPATPQQIEEAIKEAAIEAKILEASQTTPQK
ncbi:MAG: ATP-binding protein [Candidatus Methanomethylicia archaeon]|nr:ATP-binding protein [Candidatus Methanomethylicia archaeon]MCX8168927.1 ATP-binding protein [Candidatus Methanomethylicia archaeon]MDW7988659.1 ATP-binding protein [Nitrososphaerota archaeon]